MNEGERIKITRELRSALKKQMKRTGVGPTKLLRGKRHERPDGLKSYVISNWMDGKTETAPMVHLDYVLTTWLKLPDAQPRVSITPEIRAELRHHRDRTGKGCGAVLTAFGDCPDGLRSGRVHYWLDGTAKTANASHLEYVLSAWRRLPTKEGEN